MYNHLFIFKRCQLMPFRATEVHECQHFLGGYLVLILCKFEGIKHPCHPRPKSPASLACRFPHYLFAPAKQAVVYSGLAVQQNQQGDNRWLGHFGVSNNSAILKTAHCLMVWKNCSPYHHQTSKGIYICRTKLIIFSL